MWTILTDREVVQGVFCKVDNSNEVAERDDKNQTCCYAHQAVTVCCWDILNKRTQQWRRWTRSWQCRDCWKKRLWKTCQSKITGCCLFNVWAWTVCRVTIVKCVLKLCGLTYCDVCCTTLECDFTDSTVPICTQALYTCTVYGHR